MSDEIFEAAIKAAVAISFEIGANLTKVATVTHERYTRKLKNDRKRYKKHLTNAVKSLEISLEKLNDQTRFRLSRGNVKNVVAYAISEYETIVDALPYLKVFREHYFDVLYSDYLKVMFAYSCTIIGMRLGGNASHVISSIENDWDYILTPKGKHYIINGLPDPDVTINYMKEYLIVKVIINARKENLPIEDTERRVMQLWMSENI